MTARQALSAAASVVVMAKVPRPGLVKTRLEPALGPFGCARLQTVLTSRAVATASEAAAGSTYLALDDPAAVAGSWLDGRLPPALPVLAQRGTDLGARMAGAVAEVAAARPGPVLVVGTDTPSLTGPALREAARHLAARNGPDVLLGPSLDGGYYLVGFRHPSDAPGVLGIDAALWGGPRVLDATLAAVHRAGLTASLLPPLRDVDTPADLVEMCGRLPEDVAACLDVTRPSDTPDVSIVVPTLNEAACIATALRRLRQACPRCEVVVADGGSVDRTVELAAPLARVVTAPPGRGSQLNGGAAAAHGDVLWFVHADTEVGPGAFDAACSALRDPHVVAGGLRLRLDRDTPALRWVAWTSTLRARWLGQVFGDEAMFVRRAAFEAVGGFPPYPLMEDLAICKRLRRVGRLVVADADATSSARRFTAHGTARTLALMQVLKLCYAAGVPPETLRRWYEAGTPFASRFKLAAPASTTFEGAGPGVDDGAGTGRECLRPPAGFPAR